MKLVHKIPRFFKRWLPLNETYKLCFKTKVDLSEKTMGNEASEMMKTGLDMAATGLDAATDMANTAKEVADMASEAGKAGLGAASKTLAKRAGKLVADDTR